MSLTTPATINGLQFFVDSIEYDSNKKVKIHDYPNANSDYVENLGMHSPKYTVNGYFIGDDADSSYQKLIQIQSSVKNVSLVLPYMSINTTGVVLTVTVEKDTKRDGVVFFTFMFTDQQKGNQTLAPAPLTATTITSVANQTIATTTQALAKSIKAPKSLPELNFSLGVFSKFNSMLNKLANNPLSQALSEADSFMQQLDKLIYLPSELASAYGSNGVWGVLSSLVSQDPALYALVQPFCTFGNNIGSTEYALAQQVEYFTPTSQPPTDLISNPLPNSTTQISTIPISNSEQNQNINNNIIAISTVTRVNAFACLCSQACNIDYTTANEVQSTINQLSGYSQMLQTNLVYADNYGRIKGRLQDGEAVLNSLNSLFQATLEVLQTKQSSLYEVVTEKVKGSYNLVNLTYSQYAPSLNGDSTEFEKLLLLESKLNSSKSMFNLQGELRLLVGNNVRN